MPLLLPESSQPGHPKYYPMATQGRDNINTYLPMELLREVFLYNIEGNQMKYGQLASVCRHWRLVVTSIASLWSTLRVGTWTETEQVAIWLQRAYPKKIILDPQRDSQSSSDRPMFAALQNALTNTDRWNELTIVSFPPENLASQLGIQVASRMTVLKMLHVAAGCVDSPSFSNLLSLVPTEAPLTELRLHPSFANTHFLQPRWFPVLRNLTVLIVNGRDMHGPCELLPTFTRLQIFEADRLSLPIYEPNANLPLLSTLRKLRLRACSIQWMAGRQFPCLEECAILLPRHWAIIQQYGVLIPSCEKFIYHGHPMIAAQHFRVPEMRAMELRSHDCNEQRVHQHLRHLCKIVGMVSKLTTLHLTFQCSEQVLIKVLKHLVPLQELIISVAHPSPSWQNFLESLAAKPSTKDWPVWDQWMGYDPQWYSPRTWHSDVLPHLKYLGLQCPKGFSQSECLNTCPILRRVGWTRAQLTPPMEHLKVWEGRGTTEDIVVDYITTGYLYKHLGTSRYECDSMLIRGMVTKCLSIRQSTAPLLRLCSTVLFRLLEDLKIHFNHNGDFVHYGFEVQILPYLEKIKRLEILYRRIPADPFKSAFPLVDTLQWLKLNYSAFSWILGRSFKVLREFVVEGTPDELANTSRYEGLQVDLPVCTILRLVDCSEICVCLLSCPNLQIFHFDHHIVWQEFDEATLRCLTDFLCSCSRLQEIEIRAHAELGLVDSLTQFTFGDAQAQRVWRDIRSVEVMITLIGSSMIDENCSIASMERHQQHYKKWWKEFTVTMEASRPTVIVRASM